MNKIRPPQNPETKGDLSGDKSEADRSIALAQDPLKAPSETSPVTADGEVEDSLELSAPRPESLTGNENIPLLLLLLFPAGLRHAIAAIPQRIRFSLISFFGICSMIAPLALWIAPSMKVWLSILAGSLLSILFCWALVWFGPEDHY